MVRPRPVRVGVAVGLAVLLLTVAGIAVAQPSDRVLVVERTDTGETILTHPVENGTTVALEYTHSVEQSRVYDGYTVRGDVLEQTRMEFESYGWGFPTGANVTRENGTFVYDPPGSIRELSVSPGEIAGHRLHVGADTYDLVERAAGSPVRISIDRRSPLDSLL